MQPSTVISRPIITWGVAARALPGERASGDRHLIERFSGGVLIAVVDGLGHGDEAAAAAGTAIGILRCHAGESLSALVNRCHQALLKTRGAVMTLALLRPSENRLFWLGVGNVEAILVRAGEAAKGPPRRVILRSGLVGYRLPELHPGTQPLAPGDLLVLVTDGIGAGFAQDLPSEGSPQDLAEHILARHFKGTDDALALVVQYVGTAYD